MPGLIAVAQSTSGSVENVRAIGSGLLESALSQADVAFWAYNGRHTFTESGPIRNLRAIANLYPEMVHIVVRRDAGILTVRDLKGKRVSLGLRSQSDWGVYSRMMLEAFGVTPQTADVRHLTPAALTQQLIDGSTDAAVTVFGMEPNQKEWMIGGPLRQLEASGKPLRYLGLDKDTVDKVNKKWSTTFTHSVIPANTLPKQAAPLPVGLVRGYKAAHPEFPDEVAYNIVMAVAKMAPKLRDLHVLWKIWSPELMVAGLSDENVHPGAKKAYVELGWWDKVKNYPPMTYPN